MAFVAMLAMMPRQRFLIQVLAVCYACCVAASRDTDDILQETASNQICASIAQSNNVPGLFEVINNCVEDFEESKGMRRVMLSNNVTCNDGTPAGYYIRRSESSKKWIVFLEAGGYCYDEEDCQERWTRQGYLMTSDQWPSFRNGTGILSTDPDENPFWWNANHVYIPYCTSDFWSGRRSEPTRNSAFTFMGAIVVKQVIKELLNMGLKNANSLILAGSSAGGVGVIVNLEPVQRQLARYGAKVRLRGIIDSGWFLDLPPFVLNSDIITPIEAVKQGILFWRSQIPHTCRMTYPGESWKCFIGYRIYPTFPVPVFVFHWLFDAVQIHAGNIKTPVTKREWEYMNRMVEVLRNSFQNVTSVFAPSCVSHSVLSRKDWRYISIDKIPLSDALHCWEKQTKQRISKNSDKKKIPSFVSYNRTGDMYSSEFSPGSLSKHQKKKRRRSKHNKRTRKHRRRNFLMNQYSTEKCSHHLVERCSWPQCSSECPNLQHPVTGEDLDLHAVLRILGLDKTFVALALGIDIHTLNNMGQRELVSRLMKLIN